MRLFSRSIDKSSDDVRIKTKRGITPLDLTTIKNAVYRATSIDRRII